MVTDEDRLLKILDFGLAKFQPWPTEIGSTQATLTAPAGQTRVGAIMGTVPYMSPEQVEGRALDHRTDIFSLGIILYEMLTGERPFQGESTAGLTSAILRDVPPPVTESRAALPHHLERIINRCLEKEPKRRYQTARDVCNELENLKKEVETVAAEPTARDAVPSVRQRYKTPVLLGLTGAAILAVLIWRVGADSKPTGLEAPSRWRSSRLTSLGGIPSEPSLSPDGQRLLFVDYSSPVADIHEQRVGGANTNNLTEGSGAANHQPAYSPDGQRIAFRSERDGGGLYGVADAQSRRQDSLLPAAVSLFRYPPSGGRGSDVRYGHSLFHFKVTTVPNPVVIAALTLLVTGGLTPQLVVQARSPSHGWGQSPSSRMALSKRRAEERLLLSRPATSSRSRGDQAAGMFIRRRSS